MTERTVHQLWRPGAESYEERRTVMLGEQIEAMTAQRLSVETEGF